MSRGATKRMPRARWSATTLIAVAVACAAACAGPPSSGPIAKAPLNHENNQISITSKPPQGGEGPREIVMGFLAATTGDDHDPNFTTAQQFMTTTAAKSWRDDKAIASGAAVIYAKAAQVDEPLPLADQRLTPASSPSSSAAPTDAQESTSVTVKVGGTQMAARTSLGFYEVTTPARDMPFAVTVVKNATTKQQWRIDSKPDFRVLSIDDFRRAFPTPSPVFQPVVGAAGLGTASVDQVYLMPSNTLGTYQALVTALLHGRNEDPKAPKASVRVSDKSSNIVEIVLGSAPKNPKALETAIQRTLQALASTAQLGGSTQFSSFRLLDPQHTDSLAVSLQPPSAPSTNFPSVYYTVDGGVWLADGPSGNAPGPVPVDVLAGTPNKKLGKIAVMKLPASTTGADDTAKSPNASPVTIAAVVTSKGPGYGDVEVTRDAQHGRNPGGGTVPWYHSQAPDQISDLAWDPTDGTLWIVDNGVLWKVPPPKDGKMQPGASFGTIGTLGAYQRFRISPDGRQAVVVAGTGVDAPVSDDKTRALMVAIDRVDDGSDTVRLRPKFELVTQGPAKLNHIADVSWAGGRMVFLLAKTEDQAAAPPKLYKIYADGSQDSHLLDGVEEAEAQATRIAAAVADAGIPQLHVFSNGSQTDKNKGSGIYWKGRTFDLFQSGDNPVLATDTIPPAS